MFTDIYVVLDIADRAEHICYFCAQERSHVTSSACVHRRHGPCSDYQKIAGDPVRPEAWGPEESCQQDMGARHIVKSSAEISAWAGRYWVRERAAGESCSRCRAIRVLVSRSPYGLMQHLSVSTTVVLILRFFARWDIRAVFRALRTMGVAHTELGVPR